MASWAKVKGQRNAFRRTIQDIMTYWLLPLRISSVVNFVEKEQVFWQVEGVKVTASTPSRAGKRRGGEGRVEKQNI